MVRFLDGDGVGAVDIGGGGVGVGRLVLRARARRFAFVGYAVSGKASEERGGGDNAGSASVHWDGHYEKAVWWWTQDREERGREESDNRRRMNDVRRSGARRGVRSG